MGIYCDPACDLPLFQQHSETSRAAAASWSDTGLTQTQARVMAFIASRPDGATDEEIAAGLDMNPSTARPRRVELVGLGRIVKAGVRKTRSRRNADVWRVA